MGSASSVGGEGAWQGKLGVQNGPKRPPVCPRPGRGSPICADKPRALRGGEAASEGRASAGTPPRPRACSGGAPAARRPGPTRRRWPCSVPTGRSYDTPTPMWSSAAAPLPACPRRQLPRTEPLSCCPRGHHCLTPFRPHPPSTCPGWSPHPGGGQCSGGPAEEGTRQGAPLPRLVARPAISANPPLGRATPPPDSPLPGSRGAGLCSPTLGLRAPPHLEPCGVWVLPAPPAALTPARAAQAGWPPAHVWTWG